MDTAMPVKTVMNEQHIVKPFAYHLTAQILNNEGSGTFNNVVGSHGLGRQHKEGRPRNLVNGHSTNEDSEQLSATGISTRRLRKVSTFKLSLTLSNLDRFLKILFAVLENMKFATKPIPHYPPHLRHVATLPWEIKNANFLQMWKKTQTNCIFNHL